MSFRLILASASLLALAACQSPAPPGPPQAPEAAAPQPLLTVSRIEARLPPQGGKDRQSKTPAGLRGRGLCYAWLRSPITR